MSADIKIKDVKLNIKEVILSFRLLPRLIRILFEVNRKLFSVIIVLAIITGVYPVISLLSVQHLINVLQMNVGKSINPIVIASIVYICVSISNELISSFKMYVTAIYQQYLIYDLNLMLSNKALKLRVVDFENSIIYDKLSRAKNEISNKPFQIFSTILNLIKTIITLISAITIVIIWNPFLLILLIIVPLICSIYTLKVGKLDFLTKYKQASDRRKVWYLSYLITNDIGFKEIKFYDAGKYLIEKYKDIYKKLINQDKYLIKKRMHLVIICQIFQEVSSYIALILVLISAFLGKILLGTVFGLIQSIGLVQSNVESITMTILNMYKDNLFLTQLFEFLDLKEEEVNKIEECINIERINKIELKNVYFKYANKDEYTLKNINLIIHKGESISLIGSNGSGKSTLVKILTGLYSIDKGTILINDLDIHRITTESLRKCISSIFQDFLKMQMTVRENIGIANIPNLNNEESLLKVYNNSELNKINSLNKDGLNTQLGNWFKRGNNLSGGEWQKIAIARAFFRDATVFIFDEPDSALDINSRKILLKKFRDLSNEKIKIFITHGYVDKEICKRIIFLNKGEIVADGNHDELYENNLRYRQYIKNDKDI